MPANQKVRANKWCKFERIFSSQQAVRPRVGERRLPSSVFWARERAPRDQKLGIFEKLFMAREVT